MINEIARKLLAEVLGEQLNYEIAKQNTAKAQTKVEQLKQDESAAFNAYEDKLDKLRSYDARIVLP